MATPFIGQISMFGGNFAPRNWAFCNGQLLAIQQNTALFSIVGTTFGGNGQTTFGLPNMQGRSPIHWGQGPGLSNVVLGEAGGTETVTILTSNLPSHAHTVTPSLSSKPAAANTPIAGGSVGSGDPIFNPGAGDTAGAPLTSSVVGSNIPLSIRSPYVAVTFIIGTSGIFPSRN